MKEIGRIIKEHQWEHKRQKTTQSLYCALKHCYGDDTDLMITDLAKAIEQYVIKARIEECKLIASQRSGFDSLINDRIAELKKGLLK